jgi:RNA polymerase sigma-70 factor (ECF subfamily)
MKNAQLTALDDGALIARVADGDLRAFETLYDRYRAQAFGLAVRLTGRRGTAEEVTQDAFLSLWRKASHYDPRRGSVGPWLLTFVRHRAIDSLRSGARRERTVELDSAAERLEAPDRTDDVVEGREESRDARRLVKELPADQRQVIELAYFGGMTQGEIAAKVGIPLGTVKGRSRLALEKLRRSVATESPLAASR